MKDEKKLIEVIEKYAVEPYKKSMMNEIKSSIRLKTTGQSCNEIGKTKLGGCPDLTKNISWATSKYDNKYLSFLGQINLKEVQNLQTFVLHTSICFNKTLLFDYQLFIPKPFSIYFVLSY